MPKANIYNIVCASLAACLFAINGDLTLRGRAPSQPRRRSRSYSRFARVYLGLKNSGYWSTYGTELQALLPQARQAMGWLSVRVGLGHNTMTGGGAYDAFIFPLAADAGNVITDFKPGFDVIDLRAMFQQARWNPSNAADYVKLAQVGANTVVSVDPDGAGPAAPHILVTLNNVTATTLVLGVDYAVQS